MRYVPGRRMALVLAASLAVFAVLVAMEVRRRGDGWAADAAGPMVLAAALALALALASLAAAAAAVVVLRRTPVDRQHATALVAGAAALGLLASAPVNAQWHDGCNGHDSSVPVAAWPIVKITEPSDPAYVYVDGATDRFCGPVGLP